MKKVLRFLITVAGIFSAVIGALAVFDRIFNRNRIKEEYIDCSDNN